MLLPRCLFKPATAAVLRAVAMIFRKEEMPQRIGASKKSKALGHEPLHRYRSANLSIMHTFLWHSKRLGEVTSL